jgi:predicted dehydrogenase
MDKIRLIHVGLGAWGSAWARDVFPHPNVDVVAFVDKSEAALASLRAQRNVSPNSCFTSLTEAMGQVDSDAVLVCLPTQLHAPVAAEALLADKHVVVEKPFASTIQEAMALVRLAEARRRVLMVSQNYRYFPATILAAEWVRKGGFGRLGQVKIDFRRNTLIEGHNYLDLEHPLLVDMAVHHYDLARMILGEDPTELSCRTWNPVGSPFSGHASGAFAMSFPSGAVVSYRGSWADQAERTSWAGEWQMDFEKGSVTFTSRSGGSDWLSHERLDAKKLRGKAEAQALPKVKLHGRKGVLEAFATAIGTGKEPLNFPSGRSNIVTLAIIEATLRSSAAGGASVSIGDILSASAKERAET